jgi:hypothetical protein
MPKGCLLVAEWGIIVLTAARVGLYILLCLLLLLLLLTVRCPLLHQAPTAGYIVLLLLPLVVVGSPPRRVYEYNVLPLQLGQQLHSIATHHTNNLRPRPWLLLLLYWLLSG